MIKISLCMIVKNEEDVLGRCLDSIKDIVDEIIIVDTGSTDRTKEIAALYTNRIYNFQWIQDFSAARNFSFSKATMDYILWLDADDVILEPDRQKLKALKQNLDPSVDAVMMKYDVGFDNSGNSTLSYYRERLVKRSRNFQWFEPVHECIDISGNIIMLDIHIIHKKEHSKPHRRNIELFEAQINKGKQLSARGLYYYARELLYNNRLDDAILNFDKFLDMEKGWTEDKIGACFILSKCYAIKNDFKKRLKTLLRSFEYDNPKAEACCEIGNCYLEKNEYEKAIFWYDLALSLKKPEKTFGFIMHDYWGFIPHLQLCSCHKNLGNNEKAKMHNDRAAELKPDDPTCKNNKIYFESLNK